MIGDRHYMRTPAFRPQRSGTTILLIANAVVFVVLGVLEFYAPRTFLRLFDAFALSKSGVARGYVWQLLSFQFMHAGLLHLAGNLLVIYFFGRAMEDALGRSSFLKLYFCSGTIGGLLQLMFAVAIPKYFDSPVVGASAGALGLVAAYATMFPEREITLLLFFVLPISIRAKTLLWFSAGLAVFGILIPNTGLADAAHLGGIATGVFFVHWVVHGKRWPFAWPHLRPATRRPRELVGAAVPQRAFWQRPKPVEEEDLPPAEFISREVDPILDKISAHGIQSLTDRERRILEAARAKMAKR